MILITRSAALRARWSLATVMLYLLGYTVSVADVGVCAKVRLAITQDAVVTGKAFRATLEIINDDAAFAVTNIAVQAYAVDSTGRYATHVFGVQGPALTGLNAVDGTGTLSPSSSGFAAWSFIPSEEAAPVAATTYSIGGSLSYSQEGRNVSIPLERVSITVLPDAALYIKYFHQRDVVSDDPFTAVVEPAQPFYLAALLENRGAGSARNLSLTAPRLTIVENEKGLLVNFQVAGASVDGHAVPPTLTASFGDVAPGQRVLGLWALTSTLQGLFTEYQATLEYLDNLGGRQFSAFKDVEIHELIHLVQAPGALDDGKPDFLVNDLSDPPLDLPDALYLSDGTTNPVQVVINGSVSGALSAGNLSVQLTAPLPSGWAYLRVPDPGTSQYRLRRVVRSDGVEIYFGTNVWTTDRTFVGMGRPAVYEHILHLLDYNSSGVYTLYYALPPATDTNAPTSSVAALPATSYPNFTVTWDGADNAGGSGLAYFDIFASTGGGPFLHWLQRTTARTAVYPGTLGSQYAFYSIATDAAGNRETAPGTPQATTLANRTNSAPVFPPVAALRIDEGQTLVLDLSATDPDGDLLTFSFLNNAPLSMAFSATSGLITWPTTEADGPSTNVIAVQVQDNGTPRLAATNLLTIIVSEVNSPPVLSFITNRTISEGFLLTITNRVTDFDLPPNRITFTLGANRPAGATLNATNGLFRWQPDTTQGPSTNLLTIIATDNGVPSLSATQQFTVIVRDTLADFTLSLGRTNLLAGEAGTVPITLRSSLDLTNLTVWLDLPPTQLTSLTLRSFGGEVLDAILSSTGTNLSLLTFKLAPGQAPASVRDIAALDFRAVSNYHSAIVTLDAQSLLARRSDGLLVTNGAAGDGRVIIVGREPVLESTWPGGPLLTLYGRPGAGYGLEYRSNSVATGPWTEWRRFTLTNRVASFANAPVTGLGSFWRAFESRAEPPRLSLTPAPPPLLGLRLEGWPGAAYGIDNTPALGLPWQTWTNFTLTNSAQSFRWTNTSEPQRFFRGRAN